MGGEFSGDTLFAALRAVFVVLPIGFGRLVTPLGTSSFPLFTTEWVLVEVLTGFFFFASILTQSRSHLEQTAYLVYRGECIVILQ